MTKICADDDLALRRRFQVEGLFLTTTISTVMELVDGDGCEGDEGGFSTAKDGCLDDGYGCADKDDECQDNGQVTDVQTTAW